MTETVDEIDRVLMAADVEFLHGVPVHMNSAGAKAIREALASAGFAIVPVEPTEEMLEAGATAIREQKRRYYL